jgi:hypothetical protein
MIQDSSGSETSRGTIYAIVLGGRALVQILPWLRAEAEAQGISLAISTEKVTYFETYFEAVAEPLPGEAGFPRLWEILAYLLPRDARQRIYEPARAELLEDYLLSRSCRRGWWSRLAVNGVFLVRTLLLAGECGRVLFTSGAVQFWLWLAGLVVAWIIRLTQRPPE